MNHLDQTCQSQGQFDNNQYIALISDMFTPEEKAAVKDLLKRIIRTKKPQDEQQFKLLTRELSWDLHAIMQTITLEDISEIQPEKELQQQKNRVLNQLEEKPCEENQFQLEDALHPNKAKVEICESQQYSAIEDPFSSSKSSKEKSSHSREEKACQTDEWPLEVFLVSPSRPIQQPQDYSDQFDPSEEK